MQIYLVHDKYNWDSFSIVRSACEILKEREDIDYLDCKRHTVEEMQPGGYIWVFSSGFKMFQTEYEQIKAYGIKVITFGLSDPNFFNEERLKVCDLYCTNDLNTYREYKDKYNLYHFQPGVNLKYFTKNGVVKEIDVLFIGTKSHPFIPYRKVYLDRLKDDMEGFKGYGDGFRMSARGQELIDAYNRAHLNLDINTKYSSLSNSRILQAAACGTPTLTLKREDVLGMFKDGEEILTYEGGYSELKGEIIEALRDKERLARIGENARKRVLIEHGMRHRINEFIKYLGEVNGSKD